jgi:hypothetical protein
MKIRIKPKRGQPGKAGRISDPRIQKNKQT